MVNSRRKRLEREIDRDARVTTSGFVHEVMAVTLGQLQRMSLADLCPDPVDLFDEVEAITRKFRNIHRRLNDARINRRGARDRHAAAPEQVPPVVRAFAYHGVYLGAFASVEAFAHSRLDPAHPEQWSGYVDLTQAGIDLHLSGRYWTVDADGVTHAFQVGAPAGGGPPSGDDGPEDRGPPEERHHMPQHLPARALRGERPSGPASPPSPPDHAPEQARAALRRAGCDEPAVSELMTDYRRAPRRAHRSYLVLPAPRRRPALGRSPHRPARARRRLVDGRLARVGHRRGRRRARVRACRPPGPSGSGGPGRPPRARLKAGCPRGQVSRGWRRGGARAPGR